MNKIKPPTFDGEHKKEEDFETWFLGMRKYFQVQNYSPHSEGRIAMYQLKGKESMCWDQFVQLQHISEKDITWKEFQKPSFVFIDGHAPQLEFEEFLHLSVIVPFGQVFFLEIPLDLLPSDIFLSDVLHLHKLIPPHGCFSL